jgi:hypothetical protein
MRWGSGIVGIGVLALSFVLLNCRSYKVSEQGTSAENKHLLFDFREDFRELPAGTRSAISREREQRVLEAVFPGYSRQSGSCKPRRRGASDSAAPRVLDFAEGSFTAVDAAQSAYLISPGACEDDPESFGANRLAIFSGEAPALATRSNATRTLSTFDLDQDGLHELLLASVEAHEQGEVVTAHLLKSDKSGFRVAENFGRARYDTCGGNDPEGSITAAVVSYLPEVDRQTGATVARMPRFSAELYRAPCPAKSQSPQWTKIQGGSR